MKTLRFNFSHPVKGHACLLFLSDTKGQRKHIEIDSKNSNILEIPVGDCAAGRWKIILEWEYDNRSFSHQEEFTMGEVKGIEDRLSANEQTTPVDTLRKA